jgi:hypothetical protein
LLMSNERNHRTAVTLFAVALALVVAAALVTTSHNVNTRVSDNYAAPGTVGLAQPHAPLDKAPGEPVRN